MLLDWSELLFRMQDAVPALDPALIDEPEKFKPLGGLKFFNGEDLLGLVIRMLLHLDLSYHHL